MLEAGERTRVVPSKPSHRDADGEKRGGSGVGGVRHQSPEHRPTPFVERTVQRPRQNAASRMSTICRPLYVLPCSRKVVVARTSGASVAYSAAKALRGWSD